MSFGAVLLGNPAWQHLVYGNAGSEGCSTAGGCATCPFMKMNDLDSLLDVIKSADPSGAVPGETTDT